MSGEDAAANVEAEAKKREEEVKWKEDDLKRKLDELEKKEEEFKKKVDEDQKRKENDDKVKEAEEKAKTDKEKVEVVTNFTAAAAKAKKKQKDDAEMQKFKTKRIDGNVKFVCDRCDHTGNTNRAVKTHWNKKHRREAQEEEDAKNQDEDDKPVEPKKLREDIDEPKRDWMDDYDEEGNPLEESLVETTFNESSMETEITQNVTKP